MTKGQDRPYQERSEEEIWDNLHIFLEAVIPAAQEAGVCLAIHPDDPPWPVFGLPRIISNEAAMASVLSLVDDPANGLALCSGSLGADPTCDLPRMIRRFSGRIHFAHCRNVRHDGNRWFHGCEHTQASGHLDMVRIMRSYAETGFAGPMRPDHGRMIWGETGRPGYGLYDRAL